MENYENVIFNLGGRYLWCGLAVLGLEEWQSEAKGRVGIQGCLHPPRLRQTTDTNLFSASERSCCILTPVSIPKLCIILHEAVCSLL